jgi:hypothetical protein
MLHYKGYEIVPDVTEREDGDWDAHVVLERHRQGGVKTRPFQGSQGYPSKEDALKAALELGRLIIDGEVPGSTVDDL